MQPASGPARLTKARVRGQTPPLDVDEMPQLVHQNEYCEANAEFRPEHGPVKGDESPEAEQKFELKKRQQRLTLDEHDGERRQRAKLRDPWRRGCGGCTCGCCTCRSQRFEARNVGADPLGLR